MSGLAGIWTPPGAKRATGAVRWAEIEQAETLRLEDGRVLRRTGQEIPMGFGVVGKVFAGPHGMTVIVSLDAAREALPPRLHLSVSQPRGYVDWDTIVAVKRAVFGPDLDGMLPLPRDEAYIRGVTPAQKAGKLRQVFHVVEIPVGWPRED